MPSKIPLQQTRPCPKINVFVDSLEMEAHLVCCYSWIEIDNLTFKIMRPCLQDINPGIFIPNVHSDPESVESFLGRLYCLDICASAWLEGDTPTPLSEMRTPHFFFKSHLFLGRISEAEDMEPSCDLKVKV